MSSGHTWQSAYWTVFLRCQISSVEWTYVAGTVAIHPVTSTTLPSPSSWQSALLVTGRFFFGVRFRVSSGHAGGTRCSPGSLDPRLIGSPARLNWSPSSLVPQRKQFSLSQAHEQGIVKQTNGQAMIKLTSGQAMIKLTSGQVGVRCSVC